MTLGDSEWHTPLDDVCVVVLAGGRGERLGGVDKSLIEVQGVTLLERVVRALPPAASIVVAGRPQPVSRPVVFVAEAQEFGGPVSGLAAALPAVDRQVMAILAADSPLAAARLADLSAALTDGVDGVVAVDSQGRRQPLTSCWWASSLRRAVGEVGETYGASMKELLSHLQVRELPVGDEWLADVDGPEDLEMLRDRIDRGGGDGI